MPTWSWWRSSVSWSNFAVFFAVVCWRFEPAATVTTIKWHHNLSSKLLSFSFFSTDYSYISSWFRSRPRSGTHCLPPENGKKRDSNNISTYQGKKIKSKRFFTGPVWCEVRWVWEPSSAISSPNPNPIPTFWSWMRFVLYQKKYETPGKEKSQDEKRIRKWTKSNEILLLRSECVTTHRRKSAAAAA